MRPVIKHASHLSRRGCSNASESFANFSYSELSTAGVLPDGLAFEDFSPCDYLQMLQQILFSTNGSNATVTYESLVVVPETLKTELLGYFGDDVKIDGPLVSLSDESTFSYNLFNHMISDQNLLHNMVKLLDHFGHLSFRRFITFFSEMFSQFTSRRKMKETQIRSPAMVRGALMRAVTQRQTQPQAFSNSRELEVDEEPLVIIEINDFISLTFDFNFGGGRKDLLFGILFSYDSGDELADS